MDGESKARAGGWTEAEKYSLLLQIIKQIGGDKAPKFGEIDLPGRTPKAMTHIWAKIKAEVAASGGETAPRSTPATPRKRTTKGGAAADESPAKKPKAAGRKKQPGKKAEDDDEMDTPGEASDEDKKAIIKDEAEEDYEDQ